MKVKKNLEKHPVVDNLLKIMKEKGLKQERMAEFADIDPSQFSKILNGSVQISLWQLSNIATNLNMRIIDIFTFPDVYVKSIEGDEKTKILIEFEVNRKDLVELGLQNKVFKIVDK
jgi:transcriptional regulator with XRE-family HTH domain